MKKIGFVFGLHGLVFTLFMILNMAIDEYIYQFLENFLHQDWLVAVCDLIVSMFWLRKYLLYTFQRK